MKAHGGTCKYGPGKDGRPHLGPNAPFRQPDYRKKLRRDHKIGDRRLNALSDGLKSPVKRVTFAKSSDPPYVPDPTDPYTGRPTKEFLEQEWVEQGLGSEVTLSQYSSGDNWSERL